MNRKELRLYRCSLMHPGWNSLQMSNVRVYDYQRCESGDYIANPSNAFILNSSKQHFYRGNKLTTLSNRVTRKSQAGSNTMFGRKATSVILPNQPGWPTFHVMKPKGPTQGSNPRNKLHKQLPPESAQSARSTTSHLYLHGTVNLATDCKKI